MMTLEEPVQAVIDDFSSLLDYFNDNKEMSYEAIATLTLAATLNRLGWSGLSVRDVTHER